MKSFLFRLKCWCKYGCCAYCHKVVIKPYTDQTIGSEPYNSFCSKKCAYDRMTDD